MKYQPEKADKESISGLVERVTFHSPDTGFCVLRIKIRGRRELITLVGSAASVQPGEYVHATGRWNNHREHGLQFRSDLLTITPPTTTKGIERYLGSGMVKGIGPVYDSFGLSRHVVEVYWGAEDNPICFCQLLVDDLHIVIDVAFACFNTGLAAIAGLYLFA